MRRACIEVTYELLRVALHLPDDAAVLGVFEGNLEHKLGRSFVVCLAHPALPEVSELVAPPMITPAEFEKLMEVETE